MVRGVGVVWVCGTYYAVLALVLVLVLVFVWICGRGCTTYMVLTGRKEISNARLAD